MASKARFLDNVGVSAFGTNSGGGSSISSSYALSASYADFATSASYAISASYEITKEVSSSYADTASFAQSGDGNFSGSFSGSFQGDGSGLTGLEPFPFTGDAVITGSLLVSGSSGVDIEANQSISVGNQFKAGNAFLQNDIGAAAKLHLGLGLSSAAFITTQRNQLNIVRTTNSLGAGGVNLLVLSTMRDGGAEMNGDEFFTAGDNLKLYFQRSNPEDNYFGYITRQSVGYFSTTAHRAIGPHDIINPTGTTNAGAGNTIYFTSGSNYYKGITLSNEGEVNIPSGSISASYFVGDGSNLTGVGAFPFSGSAVITGSLTITGSQSNGFTPVEKLDLGRYYFKTKNSFDTGLLGSFGGELIISSSDFDYKTPMVVLDRTQSPFGDDIGTDLWARNNLFAGGSTYVNGIINTLFSVTGSGQTGQGGVINLGNPYNISPTTNVINLYGHLTASAGVNISASATSTASFGTYLGDGSQLTGITTDPFPYTGDVVITGSLVVSGSNDGIYSPNPIKAENILKVGNTAFFRSSPAILHLGLGSSTCAAISTERDCIQFRTSTLTSSFGGVIPFEIYSDKIEVNANITASGNVSSSAASTASFGTYLGDGSQLTNLPASSTFPFTGDAVITGSLVVSSSNSTASLTLEGSGSTVFDIIGSQGTLFSVDDDLSGTIFTANDISGLPILEASASGDVYIGKSPQSLYTTAVISSTTAAVTQSIFGLSTSSYDGAFFDYTVQSGSNARAGSIMSIWSGSTINYTETTTTDIGNTTDFNLIVHISQSQAQIASHATNAGYKIKTIIRSI